MDDMRKVSWRALSSSLDGDKEETFEPGTLLRADGFGRACDLVNRWRDDEGNDDFITFPSKDGVGKELYSGAGYAIEMRCIFDALTSAMEQIKNVGWITEA